MRLFTLSIVLLIQEAFADTQTSDVSYSMTFEPMCNISPKLDFGEITVNPTIITVGSVVATATLDLQCDEGIPLMLYTSDSSGLIDIEMQGKSSKNTYENVIDLKFKSKTATNKKADSNGTWGSTTGNIERIQFFAVMNENYTNIVATALKSSYTFKLNQKSKYLYVQF